MDGDSILEKVPWLKWALHGLGGGTAIVIGVAAIDAVRDRPEFLPQLLGGNVLFFAALVVGMVVFDRRLQSYADLHARGVAAQEQLAANVGALVAKDDARAEAQDAALRYMATNTDAILNKLKSLEERLPHA